MRLLLRKLEALIFKRNRRILINCTFLKILYSEISSQQWKKYDLWLVSESTLAGFSRTFYPWKFSGFFSFLVFFKEVSGGCSTRVGQANAQNGEDAAVHPWPPGLCPSEKLATAVCRELYFWPLEPGNIGVKPPGATLREQAIDAGSFLRGFKVNKNLIAAQFYCMLILRTKL